MASVVYIASVLEALRGQINFESDKFGAMLVTSGYEPDRMHARRSEIVEFEAKGEGYKAGGVPAQISLDLADGSVRMLLGGIVLKQASVGARYAVYFKMNGGEPEDDEVIACIDFDHDVVSTNGRYSVSDSVLRFA